jgi:Nucleoporin subcomplex protein binding to Pom34
LSGNLLVSKVSYFADFYRSEYSPALNSNSSDEYTWNGTNLIKGATSFSVCPPNGTKAHVVSKSHEQMCLLIDYHYSAWHVLLAFIDSFLQVPEGYEPNNAHIGTAFTTLESLKLINLILSHATFELENAFFCHLYNATGGKNAYGDTAAEKLVAMISEIFNKCCSMGDGYIPLITQAMDSMRFLLKGYPTIVWKNLRAQRLLPHIIADGYNSGSSYMQQVVIPGECSSGTYDATLAFLDLVLELVKDSQHCATETSADDAMDVLSVDGNGSIKTEILSSCLFFILNELFSSYSTWRYTFIDQKFQIGNRILKIFNAIMDDTTWFIQVSESSEIASSGRVSVIYKILFDSFTNNGASYHISPLLDIISLG